MDRSPSWRGSTSSVTSASSKPASRQMDGIDHLFYRYARDSSGLIEQDGMELLSSDLKVIHKDFFILMLAWKMQAQKRGYFTLEEWQRGLTALRADTLTKLEKAIPDLWNEVKRPSNFINLYSYYFRYCLTEERQKTIDTASVCEMLEFVLGPLNWPQVDALIQYLKIQRDYQMISSDQWMGFYRFFKQVDFPELRNYDPDHAWPLILDNFVDWMKSKRG